MRYYRYHLICILPLIFSCSILIPEGNRSNDKSKDYSYYINEDMWNPVTNDTADQAYVNPQTGSHIIFNSICKKYAGNDLKELSSSLLSGIDSIDLEDETIFTLQNRKAKKIRGSGKIDGVPFKFIVTTFQRNRCTYDIALISGTNKIYESEGSSYSKILSNIKFK